ncbi:MAG TPA: DNA repair protein RecN [Terriglobales bacterium]|nr:DNA repair protein RecN [Terriglobales bacterium]
MLAELRLENYAVIENVVIEFAPGLNLLTGETGAGKSILIDALGLLLGEKASSDVIRSGAERAMVAAVFESDGAAAHAIEAILETNGLDAENGSLILRREIAPGGKGRVFINNQPATLAVLKQIAPHLAIIHAQNESLANFDAAARQDLLDAYAAVDLKEVSAAFARWKQIHRRIAELEQDEQDRMRLLDLWNFQCREIEQARVRAGEDEELEAEKRVLANAEKIYGAAINAFDRLYEGNASTSSSLRAAQKHLEELTRYEPKFQEALTALESARISIEDVGATLRDYAGGIQASPERLAEIEERLALLDRLQRKFGPTLEQVVAYGEDIRRKLLEMENKDQVLLELRTKLAAAAEEYRKAAGTVSRQRTESARKLEKLVEAEINDLAMRASFRIVVEEVVDEDRSKTEVHWTPSGMNQVIYRISANAGETMRPLEQIASGGELARVMLALKASVEAGANPAADPTRKKKSAAAQRTLVFDEIDTGIGGRAAEAVGKKLKALAKGNQVLCVTHLPQIATFADHHYLIEKRESAGRAKTTVREITGEERTEEVARMLSGAKLTETSRKHAEQMIRANG